MDISSEKLAPESNGALDFPYWPFAYMACAQHMARDYWTHLAQLGRAATGLDLVRREGAYDAHLFGDMSRAIYGLALAPYSVFWNPSAAAAIPATLEEMESPAPESFGGQPAID